VQQRNIVRVKQPACMMAERLYIELRHIRTSFAQVFVLDVLADRLKAFVLSDEPIEFFSGDN
jgi:hypothetical protein